MNKLTLEMGWPPSVNHYKSIGRIVKTKSGKLYQVRRNSDKTVSYKHQCWVEWNNNTLKTNWDDQHSTISVEVYLYPPSKRKFDIDNPIKVLLDTLVYCKIIPDDSLIHRLFVQKMDIIKNGKVVVVIGDIGNEPRTNA